MFGTLKKILTLFIFFPFVGFIPGIDIQPFYILISCILIFLYSRKIKILKSDLIFLIASFSLMFIRVLSGDIDLINPITILKLIISVLTPFSIFLLIRNKIISANSSFILISLYIIIGVGFVQLVFPNFLTFMVSRSEEAIQRLIDSGRGVRSLFPEPSSFGKQLVLFNIILLHIDQKKIFVLRPYYYSLFLIIINLFLVRSAYSVSLHLILILIYFSSWKRFMELGLYSSIVLLFFSIGFEETFQSIDSTRLFRIFSILFDQPELLMNQGAFRRLVNIPISVNNLINIYGPFGSFGIEGFHSASLWTPLGVYEYNAHTRNLGGLIEYVLLYGIFSIPIMLWLLTRTIKVYKNPSFSLLMFTSFLLLQDGSTSNPFSWFTLFILLYQKP